MFFFAQVPVQSHSTTVDVAALAGQLGPHWFIVTLCIVATLAMFFGVGYGIFKLGSRIINSLEKYMQDMGIAAAADSENIKKQTKVCDATAENVASLCSTGHAFANAIEKIAKEMGIDVREDCAKIHEKLQSIARI